MTYETDFQKARRLAETAQTNTELVRAGVHADLALVQSIGATNLILDDIVAAIRDLTATIKGQGDTK